jgi:hypothetical protein
MPLYQVINGTTNGTSIGTALALDWAVVPFNVAFSLELIAGTGSFGVQYTLDELNAAVGSAIPLNGQSANTTVTWFNDANAPAGQTASISGNYMFPVRWIRCQVATAFANSTGAFALQFSVLQGLPNY